MVNNNINSCTAAVLTDDHIINKRFLRQYAILAEEIDQEQDRLRVINNRMIGLSSNIGDGMPHGSRKNNDTLSLQISIKQDLKDRISRLMKEEYSKRKMIEEALLKKNIEPIERQVIRLKYIDRLSWNEILTIMFSRKEDYIENEEKYQRLMYRIHGNVLTKLSKNH